jgi:hypothetical protein
MKVYVYGYVYIHSSQDTWQHPGNDRCQDTRKKRTRVPGTVLRVQSTNIKNLLGENPDGQRTADRVVHT